MVTVRVRYFQLARVVDAKAEDIVLPHGARYEDLVEEVRKKHPALTYVAMLVLVNGSPATPEVKLTGREEIDFIASPMGG
jgi:hypothetical protein